MTNEQYLLVSYFVVGASCIGLAVLAWGWLRPSLAALVDAAIAHRLGAVLRRLLLVGVVLPAMAGFFSVTFVGCEGPHDSYEKVVEDRSYLVAKNGEQLATALDYLAKAALAWGAVVAAGILITRRGKEPDSAGTTGAAAATGQPEG